MKILIAVVSCHSYKYATGDSAGHKTGKNETRATAARETWYKGFDKHRAVKFFYGQGAEREPLPDEVFLDAPDSYYELPAKVKAMFKWALDEGYDYVVKIDDDVYFRPSNFLKFFQPVDYCGYELESDTLKWASGAAYVVSKQAMKLIVDTPWDPTWNSAEDQMVGRILASSGIPLVHDHRYLCCHCPDCIKKYGLENLITIHTTKPEMMYDLHAKLGQ